MIILISGSSCGGKSRDLSRLERLFGPRGRQPPSRYLRGSCVRPWGGRSNVTRLIHRLRQRHMQLVREEVERTVLDPAEVEAVVHGLGEAVVQAEGRVRA